MTYRKDDKKDDLIKLIEKTTLTEENPIYIYIYIYIYINRWSWEKIQLDFKLKFNQTLILHHVSYLI